MKNTTPIANKTQNNNYDITINAENTKDPKAIAEEVRKAINERDSGYLYDYATVY
jgi:hypothetical protein